MKNDRRVKKTEKALYSALIELLKTKPINRVSVSELCEKADVNRNTFYAHYTFPEDILDKIAGEFLEKVCESLDVDYGSARLSRLLEYFYEHKEETSILLLSDNKLLEQIRQYNNEISIQKLKNEHSKLSQNLIDMQLAFNLHGSVEALKTWIRNGMQESPQEIADFIITICEEGSHGVAKLFEAAN